MVEGRYSDVPISSPEPVSRPTGPGDEETKNTVTIEHTVVDIRGRGFSSPDQEEQLRSQGLAVCFIKHSITKPCSVTVNGVQFELPIQTWIRVPVSVRDVLANAGMI